RRTDARLGRRANTRQQAATRATRTCRTDVRQVIEGQGRSSFGMLRAIQLGDELRQVISVGGSKSLVTALARDVALPQPLAAVCAASYRAKTTPAAKLPPATSPGLGASRQRPTSPATRWASKNRPARATAGYCSKG